MRRNLTTAGSLFLLIIILAIIATLTFDGFDSTSIPSSTTENPNLASINTHSAESIQATPRPASRAASEDTIPTPRAFAAQGIVITETGSPIAGALIYRIPADYAWQSSAVDEPPPVLANITKTNNNGEFSFESVDPPIALLAFKKTIGWGVCKFTNEPHRITIWKEEPWKVLLKNAQGDPIRDAQITIRRIPFRALGNASFEIQDSMPDPGARAAVEEYHLSTNSLGTADFIGVSRGQYYITIKSAGYATYATTATLYPGQTTDIVLYENVSLSGTVTSAETGAFIENAQVQLLTNEKCRRPWSPPTHTDKSGQFRIEMPGGGFYNTVACVDAPGFARSIIQLNVPEEKTEENLIIKLQKNESLSGLVIDHNKNPIAGATVSVHTIEPSTLFLSCSTDRSGTFTIESLSPNTKYELIARKEQYGTVVHQLQQFGALPEPIILHKGGRLVFEFSGSLPARDGLEPIKISLRKEFSGPDSDYWRFYDFRFTGSTLTIETDGPGKFTTQVDVPHRALVNSGTYTLSSGSVIKIPVDLGHGVRVSGRIISRKTGMPIEGAEIYLLTARHENGDIGEQTGRTAISNSDGVFELDSVAPGKVDIWCTKSDFVGKHEALHIKEASDFDAGIIKLATHSAVNGKVSFSESLPSGTVVFLDTPVGTRFTTKILPDKTYGFYGLTRGEWYIGLLVPQTGDCSTEKFFVDDAETRIVNLEYGPSSLTGVVRGGPDIAFGRVNVAIYDPATRIRLAIQSLNSDRTFTFAGMPDRMLQIAVERRASGRNAILLIKSIRLKRGITTVDIDLPNTELIVNVEDRNRNPLQNIEVYLAKSEEANYRGLYAGTTNEKGSMLVTGMEPGTYVITLRGTGYEYASRWNATVSDGKTMSIRAQLKSESTVTFSVIDTFGNPVPDARARVTRHDDPAVTIRDWLFASSKGIVVRDGLESFTYNCLILAPDFFPSQTQITPPPEKATNLSVTLFPRGNLKIHFVDSTGAPVQSRNIDITFNEKRLSGTYDSWITNGWVTFLNEASPGQSTQIELGGVPANVDLIISGGGGIATVRVEPGKTAETILVVD